MSEAAVELIVRMAFTLTAFLVFPLVIGMMEHKAMAHMQSRLGPMHAGGFHGWAQLVADAVKFVQKESVFGVKADSVLFGIAPVVALIAPFAVLSCIPLSEQLDPLLDQGLFVVLALMAISIVATLMAGWASASKFSLLGAMRGAAQLMAYELPMVLAAASVAMAAGTLALSGIVHAWTPMWLAWQLPALVIFFISGLAELQRGPFDAPIAESEIIFGAYTEYSGLRFALFIFTEYAGILVLCGLTTVLFLGGWRGPWLNPDWEWVWTLAKTLALAFVVIWLRVSYPRLREDQIQRLAWVWLVPIGLAQLALTGVVKVLN